MQLGPYLLGPNDTPENGIYIGDALNLIKQIPDWSIDLILTDPPYDFDATLRKKFQQEFLRVSKYGVIVFCPPENPWQIPADQYLFWIKPISTKNTSKKYSRFVEEILIFGNLKWNHDGHWSQYTNVFTDLVVGRSDHPYEKPKSLIERLIRNHSEQGDIILDPFCGSGTILLVCKEMNRRYLAFELDEKQLTLF